MPKKKRSSLDSARQRRRSDIESSKTQSEDLDTEESTTARFSGKQLKERHAIEKATYDADVKEQKKLLKQAQTLLSKKEEQLKVFRRGRDRSSDSNFFFLKYLSLSFFRG